MLTVPTELLPLMGAFAPLFSQPVWKHAQGLLVGAILATGKRTVTACLHGMGLSQAPCVVNYHRVLNRARWSLLAASRILLRLLVARFAPAGELGFGLDDTIARWRVVLRRNNGLMIPRRRGRKLQSRIGMVARGGKLRAIRRPVCGINPGSTRS